MNTGTRSWPGMFRIAVIVLAGVLASSCTSNKSGSTEGAAGAVGSAPRAAEVTADRSAKSASAPRPGGVPLANVAIATGDVRDTNYEIGRDLATYVAPEAAIALDVVVTKGSADNLHRLTEDPKVDLAIVQYDVVQAFVEEASRGNAAAQRIVKPLRIVTPLYTEEMNFIVRSDSPMKSVDDIRGHRINLGARGSGSALTAANLYRRMFQAEITPAKAQFLPDDQALTALTVDKSVDVVIVVAAQPARLFRDMKSQASSYIKLLKFDANSAPGREALKTYFPATIRAGNYAWLSGDVPSLSVMSFLVTTSRASALTPHLAGFASAMCSRLATLRAEGHPKWREVELGRQLVPRWNYEATTAAAFRRCAVA